MANHKFKFNPETLEYEKIKLTTREKIIKAVTYLLATFVASVIIVTVFSIFFDLPKEKQLKRENNQLATQYDILNQELDNIKNVLKDIEDRDDNIYRLIFGVDPIHESVRKAGYGGVNKYAKLEGFNSSDLIIETAKKIDQLKRELVVQSKSYDQIIELALNKEEMWASIPAIQPLSDNELTRFASGFGYRIHPIYKTRKMHTGVDLTAPVGTKIYATGNGKVISAGRSRGGYGKKVVIEHGYDYKTLYAHLSKVLVRRGQKVKRGDVIGLVGNTGRSTAPHLHYEVLFKNRPVNPINYYFKDLTPEEYDKMIEISSRPTQSFD